ncbi:hypothetical protein FQN57_001891 [Myotisia sp. PD_48]|nr:hypothetical protein FQN57_001891 [Myotisia sp. PD_48]
MKPATIICLVAQALAVAATVTTGNAEYDDEPSCVKISSLTYDGTGCYPGTIKHTMEDPSSFTLIHQNISVAIGPAILLKENRRNCRFNVQFAHYYGYQFYVHGTQTKANYKLDENITATWRHGYYFSGQTSQIKTSNELKGPMDKDFSYYTRTLEEPLWSACGHASPLNIISQLGLTSTDNLSNGTVANHSHFGNISFSVHIRWKRCTTPSSSARETDICPAFHAV